VRAWFATQRADDAIAVLQEVRVAAGPARSLTELLSDGHLAAREFWRRIDGVAHPGPPARIDGLSWHAGLAQLEAYVNMIGHAVVEAATTGDEHPGPGSRSDRYAPQGVYPCAGADRWIAISVVDDASWWRLAELAAMADLALLGATERQRRHDEIDERLASWTVGTDHVELAWQLQGLGVAAAPVVDAPLLAADPHLAAREAFFTVDHPSAGPETWPHTPIRFVGRRRPAPRSAGRLGEHNHEVLVGEAGLGEDEYRALVDGGALADRPPG
jgi:crotonobetainyl-CoA:carnitine CoA-transferase CaiB-like acyl-CoA transferase